MATMSSVRCETVATHRDPGTAVWCDGGALPADAPMTSYSGPPPPDVAKQLPLCRSHAADELDSGQSATHQVHRHWRARDDLGVAPFVVRTGVIWSGHSRR